VTVLVAALYCAIGVGFAALAGAAGSHPAQVRCRLAAWILSAVVFVAHVWYTERRQQLDPRRAAWRAGGAVALGGLGLALAASLHNHRPLALALVVWPLVLGVPAYAAALLGAMALRLAVRRPT
jgi:hypothetical protein